MTNNVNSTDYSAYDDMEIIELAQAMSATKDQIDALGAEKTTLQKLYDHLRMIKIPAALEEMGVVNMNIKGVGRVYTQQDVYASIKKDMKEQAFEWLEENGFGDMMTETVNSSALKAWARRRLEEGTELPDDLFNITPYEFAKIQRTITQ